MRVESMVTTNHEKLVNPTCMDLLMSLRLFFIYLGACYWALLIKRAKTYGFLL